MVIFYALRSGPGETIVTVRRIEQGAVAAYTRAPGPALDAVRGGEGRPRADGFRITDERGLVVFDCLIGHGRR